MDTMENDVLVRVENLSRNYGPNRAVDQINFEVSRGEVLGFLGPNGAGKTTTMQMLSGNLAPTAGRVTINKFDILDQPKLAKVELGYLPEQPPLYKELTVNEYLVYCARLNKIQKNKIHSAVESVKEKCGLTEHGKRLIANLSKGFQQRVGIAQAIIHVPAVVILDEPTVGLDPIQIREIRTLIRDLGGDHSVILSTHILPEVQSTCDRVQIINKGKIVLTDTIEGLEKRMQGTSILVSFKNPPAEQALKAITGVESVDSLSVDRFRLHVQPQVDPIELLVESSVKQKWGLRELSQEKVSLEEVFVDITRTEHLSHEADQPVTEEQT